MTASLNSLVTWYPPETIATIALGMMLIGILLGLFKKTIIFYDYDDMAMCFAVFAAPVAMWFILQYLWPVAGKMTVLFIALPSVLFFGGVLYKTWKSGVRWTLPIVLLTKLFFGFFYVFAIWHLLSPMGNSGNSRRRNRALAMFFLMVFTPIFVNLVANKTGVFFGPSHVKARGIRGIGAIRKQMEK